jgi:protein-S-isoprenylcysteine O-methyltransferase Ste14
MSRPVLARVLLALLLGLSFGVRTLQQRRATGSAGFHGLSGRPGSPAWLGGALLVAGLVLGALAPVAELLGWTAPVAATDPRVGAALALLGTAATDAAQRSMGRSWRIGVREGERTALVTAGPFAWVRDPIFSAMLATAAGLARVDPNRSRSRRWPAWSRRSSCRCAWSRSRTCCGCTAARIASTRPASAASCPASADCETLAG